MNKKSLISVNPHLPQGAPASTISVPRAIRGKDKVVAGGRVVQPNQELPPMERLVTGEGLSPGTYQSSYGQAVLESVESNIQAGVTLLDRQRMGLAKIGGRLSAIALSLNQVKSPKAKDEDRVEAQKNLENAKDTIRSIAQTAYNNTALFSNGPAKPITVAVPNRNEWEGISLERPNLSQPGLSTVLSGKVDGDKEGVFLDAGPINRAFDEWRSLCVKNRLHWAALMDRLHGVKRKLADLASGLDWSPPAFPKDQATGPLRRPNRNN